MTEDELPAAPTAEAWEPFLRRKRDDDEWPVPLTVRQLARIQYIADLAAFPERCTEPARAQHQMQLVATFLSALFAESGRNSAAYVSPTSAAIWQKIEAEPYYIQTRSHRDNLSRQ